MLHFFNALLDIDKDRYALGLIIDWLHAMHGHVVFISIDEGVLSKVKPNS